MHEIEELMAGLDRPVALPAELRASLAEALVNDGEEEPLLAGIDAPHSLSSAQHARLTDLLLAAPTPVPIRRPTRWLAVAAAIVFVIGGIAVATNRGHNHPGRTTAAVGAPQHPGTTTPAGSAAPGVLPEAANAGPVPSSAAGAGASSPFSNSGGATAGAATDSAKPTSNAGPEPPFAFGSAPAAAAMPANSSGRSAAPQPAPAAVVAVVSGNAGERDGFNAYLSLLSRSGSRQIRVVPAQTRDAAATVNLSDAPLSQSTTGPVMETLAVPEGVLHSPVYDVASAPVHQARVSVAATFPGSANGKVAVVYRGAHGVWSADVQSAVVAALHAKGATVVVMNYVPGAFQAVPADVAFLSLSTADARSWLADAGRANYRPAMGVSGISSLVDPSLLPMLPEGSHVVGAYDLPGDSEQAALASAIHRSPGMAEVHGWVTAKVLSVALWKSGATTPAQVAAALADMAGYSDGWAPPLTFRAGTTSRTPDGVVFGVHGGAFVTSHSFETDPG